MSLSKLFAALALSLLVTIASSIIFMGSTVCLIVDGVHAHVRLVDAARRQLEADIGRVIAPAEWPSAMLGPPSSSYGWRGPYARTLVDKWRRPFGLKLGVGVYSFGEDGVDADGMGDDIASWREIDRDFYPRPYRIGDVITSGFALTTLALGATFVLVSTLRVASRLLHRHR